MNPDYRTNHQPAAGDEWLQRTNGGAPAQEGEAWTRVNSRRTRTPEGEPTNAPPPVYTAAPPVQPPVYRAAPPVPPPRTAPEAPEAEPQKTYVQPKAPTGRHATPPTGLPPRRGTPKGVYIALAACTVLFAVLAVILMLGRNRQSYAYVQADTMASSHQGDAIIVRNETVYSQESISRIEYIAKEGAYIERTEPVCTVYSTGFSEKELTTLENYRRQIKEYHKTLLASSTTRDAQMDRLESNVLSLAMETQNLIQMGQGDLEEQEKSLTLAMQNRQYYMRQKYPDDQKLARLYDDENTQMQRISSWTKQYAAAANGIVSFYADGYENVLNLTNYGEYTPAQVRNMIQGRLPEDSSRGKSTTAIYRLVRQGEWMVLMLCRDRDWVPVEGETYKMMIEGFDNTTVSATVVSFTRSGGELLVRLSISGDINNGNALYMRVCSVAVGESVDSLTVPRRALYTRQGRIGVVMATESGDYWTQVQVLSIDGDVAHIVPANPGVLYEGVPVLLF